MLKVNPKNGDLTLSQPAWVGLIALVFGFGTWMTKMQYDVSGWYEVGERVAKVEKILLYNHLDAPGVVKVPSWPEPSPKLPYWPALASSPAVDTKRVLE